MAGLLALLMTVTAMQAQGGRADGSQHADY